jgi:cytosine/adenosine deaminase-related metal-dependent hydrolase
MAADMMKLVGARVALSAERAERIDLVLSHGRIRPFDEPSACSCSKVYDLSGHLLLPGLINSHDHLEFNLFPRLGKGPYPSARSWAKDIYRPSASPVREHLAVPKSVRLQWGGLKNLLSGVTTVAHHNPYEPAVFDGAFPIRVVRRYGWAHSLDFSPDLATRHRQTPLTAPFVLHAAEGTDRSAQAEISRLDELGILDNRTALVHAVGASAADAATLRRRQCSVVWCPSSNLFTLAQTLQRGQLESGVPIALGTDSALTADGDLIDEMSSARCHASLSAEQLYRMVTTTAARVLRLRRKEGSIASAGVADLVAVRDTGQSPADAVAQLRPEIVIVGGRVRLMSARFAQARRTAMERGFHPMELEGRGRWFVKMNVPKLLASSVNAIGSEIRLAGRRVGS